MVAQNGAVKMMTDVIFFRGMSNPFEVRLRARENPLYYTNSETREILQRDVSRGHEKSEKSPLAFENATMVHVNRSVYIYFNLIKDRLITWPSAQIFDASRPQQQT